MHKLRISYKIKTNKYPMYNRNNQKRHKNQ